MEKKLTGYPSIDKPWLKYYSEKAIAEPLFEGTVFDYLWENNKDYLDRTALSYYGRKITFKELFDIIKLVAAAFLSIGVKKGDVVIVSSITTPETIYTFYALNLIGAISNMVDPRTSIEGIHDYISEVKSKTVVSLDVAYPKIIKAVDGTDVERVIVTSPADSLLGIKKVLYGLKNRPPKLTQNSISWDDFIQKGDSNDLIVAPYTKDECCVIVHTGGTTGMPKGVMLSNDNINALVQQSILTEIDMQRIHTWMDIMPPFIAYGIGMGIHLPLVIGMETILIPAFDADKFDSLLVKHKPVHMVFVPSYWGTIINSKKLKKADMSYIIAPTVGGDTMDPALEVTVNQYLKDHGCSYAVTKGYGMTEVCAGVTGTLDSINEIGSVGVPFVKTVISVFDPETGIELKYNTPGEICITGPNVMLGYYNNQDATNEMIRLHEDGQCWVHTGDYGYMNERGSLFIIDRIKRMIVRYDGFKIFPSLVEKTINSHYAIQDCCVVGKKDSEHRQGSMPIAFITMKQDANASFDEVVSDIKILCNKELPEYAQPIAFKEIKKLPVTPIGKIDYRALEEIINC